MVGGALGHTLCTGLAVLGGRLVAQRISVRTGNFCTNWRHSTCCVNLMTNTIDTAGEHSGKVLAPRSNIQTRNSKKNVVLTKAQSPLVIGCWPIEQLTPAPFWEMLSLIIVSTLQIIHLHWTYTHPLLIIALKYLAR